MLKKINRCDIYVIIWVLYRLQGTLYSTGIINKFLQLIMLLWALLETFNVLQKKIKSPILKSTLLLLIMYFIYGGWCILFGDIIYIAAAERTTSNYVYLQNSLTSLLPIFMFYHYTKIRLLDKNRIIIYTIIFLLNSLHSFYKNANIALIESGREESTNNAAYGFLNLIPLIYFYYKRPTIQYILLGICGIFILLGMKRGAILIGAIAIILFLYSNLKSASIKRKIIISLFTTLIIIGGIRYTKNLINTSSYFQYRIEQTREGSSSGRNEIYAILWDTFIYETDPINVLFGRGANATVGIAGNFAHNDWLETLTNNGILGGVLLLIFFITLIKVATKQRKKFPSYMYYSFITLIIIMFSKTIFSMSIQSIGIAHSMLLGYLTYWSTRPKEETHDMINA